MSMVDKAGFYSPKEKAHVNALRKSFGKLADVFSTIEEILERKKGSLFAHIILNVDGKKMEFKGVAELKKYTDQLEKEYRANPDKEPLKIKGISFKFAKAIGVQKELSFDISFKYDMGDQEGEIFYTHKVLDNVYTLLDSARKNKKISGDKIFKIFGLDSTAVKPANKNEEIKYASEKALKEDLQQLGFIKYIPPKG